MESPSPRDTGLAMSRENLEIVRRADDGCVVDGNLHPVVKG